VCWCSTSADSNSLATTCTESGDFRTRAGQFVMNGPKYASTNLVISLGSTQNFAEGNGGAATAKVTSGHKLSLTLTVSASFENGDQLVIIKVADTCGDAVETAAANGEYTLESMHSTDMGNSDYPMVNSNSGAFNKFENIVLNIPDVYKFCWCPKSAVDANECKSTGEGYIVPIGEILVEGPDGTVNYAESHFKTFSINVQGTKIDANNRIRIAENSVATCGDSDSKTMFFKIVGLVPEYEPASHSSSSSATWTNIEVDAYSASTTHLLC